MSIAHFRTVVVTSIVLVAKFAGAENISLSSPDNSLKLRFEIPKVNSSQVPTWSASFNGSQILTNCRLSIELIGQGDLFSGAKLKGESRNSSNKRIRVLFGKVDYANDNFREMRIELQAHGKDLVAAVFRCYNDAVALRYEISKGTKQRIVIADEGTSFQLAGNPKAFVQYLENYKTSHEHPVDMALLQDVKPGTLLDMPATFVYQNGSHVAITDAALRQYAGMALMRTASDNSLVCKLTPRPDGTKVIRQLPMETPWRVVMIGKSAGSLLESNVLHCLNKPNETGDTSWIKPGKMTWPWWNGNVVKDGKDEPPIFSFEAQKAYIDFCAANGILYQSTIADNTTTPWYFQTKQGVSPGPDTDVTRVRPELDLKAIRNYADAKGVRLWTWVHQAALKGRVEEAFAAFEKLGWKGMMVDFFDHDDQDSVEHAEAILKAAARHHILIHFHGIWKPTGLERTFPNLMNNEASLNLEVYKWGSRINPEHTLNLLFTRMLAGPMDYHSGGFRSVKSEKFAPHFVGPNVMGSRCNMLASYVCFDNPNPMIADFPDAYANQPGFDFLKLVPTWWDETRVLASEIGSYIVTARRKGQTWYIGVMSAKKFNSLSLPLSFLGNGSYSAKLWKDSTETEFDPNKLITTTEEHTRDDVISVQLASDGGGFVGQFTPIKQLR